MVCMRLFDFYVVINIFIRENLEMRSYIIFLGVIKLSVGVFIDVGGYF